MELHLPNRTCSTQVALAARQGNLEELKRILDNGEPAYVTDKRGWSPVHEAAFAGYSYCLVLLSKHEFHGKTEEFNIDCQTLDGETALILACKEGRELCAQILLENGANVDIINWKYTIHRWFIKGCTALHTAVRCNYPEIVKLLLKYKAEICCGIDDITPVYIASEFGHVECLKLLLEELKQQERLSVVNKTSYPDNASPLLKSCENGHDLCVKLLLDCEANQEDVIVAGHRKSGSELILKVLDPLQCAIRGNYLRCVQLLLQYNSRKPPNLYAHDDLHPLCLAVPHSDIDCLKLLINYGFDPDQLFYDDSGNCGTLLCFHPSYQAAEFILEQRLSDLTKDLKQAPNQLDPIIECLNGTGNISKLSQVLLVHGARIEGTVEFWEKILKTKIVTDCSQFRLVSAYYFLTKSGCEMKNVFKFVQTHEMATQPTPPYGSHRPIRTRLIPDLVGVLSLYMLLTTNIRNQKPLIDERMYPVASRVLRQVEADSHTLQHACRIAVVRRMISLDNWDSDGLERLGVPNLIKEYLKYMEYGHVGDNFRSLISAQRSYWNGTMTVSELEKKLMKLHMR